MFEDYKNEVLAAYKRKLDEASLSPNLLDPTPGNLRSECLIVYRERYTTNDDEILRLFFSATDKGYIKSIENFKVDGFRQVSKILKGTLPNPGIKYIELIAWLINFTPRPSTLFYSTPNKPKIPESRVGSLINDKPTDDKEPNVEIEDEENIDTEIKEENKGQGKTAEELQSEDKGTNKLLWKKTIIATLLLIVISAISLLTYQFLTKESTPEQLLASIKGQKCMYWTGDHYQPISCNQKVNGTLVIGLDTQKLVHLRKITREDTITMKSLGKIWYSKINNQVEFYTDSGEHPTDNKRILKPASEHILVKYVLSKR
jgi:hypothetical protein